MKSSNYDIGQAGERMGENFLRKKGYQIVARNVRCPFGEIDLIAKHQKTLVFIEIKTRQNQDFGFAEEAVTQSKIRRMGRLASWYLAYEGSDLPIRFDVLAIELESGLPEYRLTQNAFEIPV